MKKIISMAAILVCLSVFANAQTSLAEYEYVTAGYKEDMYKGLGLKHGYSLEKTGITLTGPTIGNIAKSAHVFYLKKNDVTKALMVKFWDSESNRNYYCIPTSDADPKIWNLAFKAIADTDKESQMLLTWILGQMVNQNCITL